MIESTDKCDKPKISFLVCTRNRAEIVLGCVQNLLNSGRTDIEVIVRDNCSTDNTLDKLGAINDSRLKVYSAPENQGTLNFFEISKLSSGQIVTWLSDEDDFQFEHLDYLIAKFEESSCNVILGSIIVGNGYRVILSDKTSYNLTEMNLHTLLFSGCGGVFVRSSCLGEVHTFNIANGDDAYALWNNYPVGFFASRCLNQPFITSSRIFLQQTRFSNTTNNWNANTRLPHYYPETVFDRLASNIVNVYFKNIPVNVKLSIVSRLIRGYYNYSVSYKNPNFILLLEENYDSEIVKKYINHINKLKLDRFSYRVWYLFTKTIKLIPVVRATIMHWNKLKGT